MPRKKKTVKEWNLFKCLSCKSKPEFTLEKLKAHLKDTHGITETKGIGKLTSHLDGIDFFQSDYEWQIGEVKLAQQVHYERDEEGKAHWGAY